MSYSDFNGKVAIVTGAAGGIGKALVEAFVAEGLRVAALDLDEAGLASLEAAHGADTVLGLRCDVTDAADCIRQVETVRTHFGSLHMLVNNAALGMNSVSPNYGTGRLQIEDVPVGLWQRFMAANVNGPFFMAHAVMPGFRRQHWGRIVNVSTSFFTMMRPGFSPYGPTKAALEAWSLMFARELEGSGITVNVVLPGGPADTAMVPDEEGLDRSTLIPPAVMAAPILGLFTDAGAAVTGRRFIAVEWDPARGADPSRQESAWAAWPDLARALATRPPQPAAP
ncbi:3-phenylpropionate-dihydrodiol/cinnamic acid-dihydrodiol dehydrogenase [Labrys miyagiensis]